MDKKKTLTLRCLLASCALLVSLLPLQAQKVDNVHFCDKKNDYRLGCDSITLYLKFTDRDGESIKNLSEKDIEDALIVKEDGKPIPSNRVLIERLGAGRIPSDYTFSVLIDRNIPREEMEDVYEAVGQLIDSAPDSCVYLSFFGDEVSSTEMVTRNNYASFRDRFFERADGKYIYDAVYEKIREFNPDEREANEDARVENGYKRCKAIARRADGNDGKNVMFVFTEGNTPPGTDVVDWIKLEDYVREGLRDNWMPIVHAFYYTAGQDLEEHVDAMLDAITRAKKGRYCSSADQSEILEKFSEVVNDAKYDYAFTYKVPDDANYSGRVNYTALWDGDKAGSADYSIGTHENPWPKRAEPTSDFLIKYFVAFLITFFLIAFFFFVMKVIIPFIKSKMFAAKYYKSYYPEAGIQKRVCYYCKQPIIAGQKVVVKCKHVMHVHCWQQNGYQCSEYGQNCKTGIQDHVHWSELFTFSSFRDCSQAISGIFAGLVSWVVYELLGRGMFTSLAASIANLFLEKEQQGALLADATNKVSAFFSIGMLLAFFLSLVFRFNDEYRSKSFSIYMKIFGLSLLSALIGFLSFLVGGVILCMLLSSLGVTYIPWYCSLPAYLLFSVCTSLSLTIKSSIPVKSAMIGGLCSAVIGFLVLYFSNITSTRFPWLSMLLDFIIYGGGLGASLVTVRLLAEKYFLVIMNGVKQGTRIPIHKWMNATGGGNKVSIGMTGDCEIQMNWDKSNRVAKEHAVLYIDQARSVPVIKPMATGVTYNQRAELPVSKPSVLSNSDTFQIGDTVFQYVETD